MFRWWWLTVLLLGMVGGCDGPTTRSDKPQPQGPATGFSAAKGYDPDWAAARSARPRKSGASAAARAVTRTPNVGDPLRGRWSLEQATATMPKGDRLMATIATSMGDLKCELWPDQSPKAVALFVGLANGTRPWKTRRGWLRRPAFDRSRFDPVIPSVAIHLNGLADVAPDGPGLTIPNESWPKMARQQPGLLSWASQGDSRVGMTLMITDGSLERVGRPVDAGPAKSASAVLGTCSPLDLIHQIASVPTSGDHPGKPVTVERIRVVRK